MFQKIVTSVDINGNVTTEKRDTVAAADVYLDMDAEHSRISAIARSDRGSRIKSVEGTTNTLVITYVHGAVKIYHWVAEV